MNPIEKRARHKEFVLAMLLVCASAVAQSGEKGGPPSDDGSAKRTATAKAAEKAPAIRPGKTAMEALKKAKGIAAGAKGKKGEERESILAEAAAEYEAIARTCADDAAGCAQASFDAAEIWRKQGALDRARPLYEQSILRDRARYEARAALQLAHLARRGAQLDEALELYRRVAGIQPASGRAHEARLWVGKCLAQQGKTDDALRAYEAAVTAAVSARQKIGACDRLAALLVAQGRLDDAESAIATARDAVEIGDSEEEAETAALDKAFERMASRRALQRARDKTNGAHRDAEDVEGGRSGS